MRALTLTQPWAGLVASGIKRVENRPRAIIKSADFGKPFAIHASREIDERVYQRIFEIAPELLPADEIQAWQELSRITSAVIAVATIDSMLRGDGLAFATLAPSAQLPDDQRRWFFGPIGYVLRDNVRALTTAVPCRGWQGFWTLTHELERAVVEQIGGPP